MSKVPVLLMVSGGSDSTALLELATAYTARDTAALAPMKNDCLIDMLASALPEPEACALEVLHVNHMLRGKQSDEDESFVLARCAALDVSCEAAHADIASLLQDSRGGVEAVARKERYRLATLAIERACEREGSAEGLILTAHTLDDRIETFFMRSLVGTGPGGLGSIPRSRGNIRRPLLDATREQLREWLRCRHPGVADEALWREDETNTSGENFRSQLRLELMPVLRKLRPGFEHPLSQTMDLIADEEEELQQQSDAIVYRALEWDGETACIPVTVLKGTSRPIARRIVRTSLLVVYPDARLEAAQIERILDGMQHVGFASDVSGGIRVNSDGNTLFMKRV